LQVKLCDPCLSALSVPPWPKKHCINTLPFLYHLDPSSRLATINTGRKLQPFGRNGYGPKIGGGLCPFVEGVPFEHNLARAEAPARQVSSCSVKPFGHNTPTSQTDRTDRQIDRQRSDSIGRTVLQTVAQKRFALRYQTVVCLPVCLSVLSVTFVYCGQTVGWMNQDETWHGGRPGPATFC